MSRLRIVYPADPQAPPRRSMRGTPLEWIVLGAVGVAALFATVAIVRAARAAAGRDTCLGNEHLVALGILLYAQDYDSRPPPPLVRTVAGVRSWHILVGPFVKQKSAWNCPEADLPAVDWRGRPICHYGYNARYLNVGVRPGVRGSLVGACGVTLDTAIRPDKTVLLCDVLGTAGRLPHNRAVTLVLPPSEADADYWGRPDWRHAGGCNVQLLDGHARWFRRRWFYAGRTPADEWFEFRDGGPVNGHLLPQTPVR